MDAQNTDIDHSDKRLLKCVRDKNREGNIMITFDQKIGCAFTFFYCLHCLFDNQLVKWLKIFCNFCLNHVIRTDGNEDTTGDADQEKAITMKTSAEFGELLEDKRYHFFSYVSQ